MAGHSADSNISSQIILLVAGIVLGSVVGFLSEIAKEQYTQLESRHVVRVNTLPEAKVDCDQSWESPPPPIGRPTQCRKIGFSMEREGSGSIPSLEVTVSLKNHVAAIVSASADLRPESFPPNIEITDTSSNERFYSRTVGITQFRDRQKLFLIVFLGSQGQIPGDSGRVVLNSSDEKLVVLDGSDHATLYLIAWYCSIFVVIVLAVIVLVLWSRLQPSRNLKEPDRS